MNARRPLVVGNWKMHGSRTRAATLVQGLREGDSGRGAVSVAVCPPYPYLADVQHWLSGSDIAWGAQDLSVHVEEGAHTGEVSGDMLKDFGCRYVIVGHSERRADHGESDNLVAAKAKAALAAGLTPIVCVGETQAEREAEQTLAVVARQLAAVLAAVPAQELVLAYEPVWAIGTGLTATPEQAQAVHRALREQLGAADTPVLYGGSVKPDNAAALFAQADIDGALVGGAALQVNDFLAICQAAAG